MELLPNLSYLVLAVVLLQFVAQFLIAPILVYFTSRHAANPLFIPFDPANPPLPLPPGYFASVQQLNSVGFLTTAHLYSDTQVPGTRICLTLLANQSNVISAYVAFLIGSESLKLLYFEFTSDYADGSEISTSNVSIPGIAASTPEKVMHRVPHLKGVRALYQLHLALTAGRQNTPRKLPRVGEEISYLSASVRRDLERMAGQGYYYLDPTATSYRPTVKGALLMTWRLAWPSGPIRKMRQERQGRRLAQSHGIA